ncbi:hypothetical protein GCM10023178_33680 [Actinomadura luteofluorescens]
MQKPRLDTAAFRHRPGRDRRPSSLREKVHPDPQELLAASPPTMSLGSAALVGHAALEY